MAVSVCDASLIVHLCAAAAHIRHNAQLFTGDARAMKSAGHELKSLMRYYQCEGISVPLMALIDYRGFRLVAMSILPITGASLVYGSKDGGKTVLNSNSEFAAKMERAAKQLNIKGHPCGFGRDAKVLHGPTDIEGAWLARESYAVVVAIFCHCCRSSQCRVRRAHWHGWQALRAGLGARVPAHV